MMPEENTMEYRVRALELDSGRNQVAHKEFYDRFEKMKSEAAVVAVQYANIMEKLGKLESAVDELKGRPARRWDALVAALLSAVVGVAVGLLIKGGV